MRNTLAALALICASAQASAASLDLSQHGLRLGAQVLDAAVTVEVTNFGDGTLSAFAETRRGDPAGSVSYYGLSDKIDGNLSLNLSRASAAGSVGGILEAVATKFDIDQDGGAFLFKVVRGNAAFPALTPDQMIYASISGDFSGYKGGDYRSGGRLTVWSTAPVPAPISGALLSAAFGVTLLLRRAKS